MSLTVGRCAGCGEVRQVYFSQTVTRYNQQVIENWCLRCNRTRKARNKEQPIVNAKNAQQLEALETALQRLIEQDRPFVQSDVYTLAGISESNYYNTADFSSFRVRVKQCIQMAKDRSSQEEPDRDIQQQLVALKSELETLHQKCQRLEQENQQLQATIQSQTEQNPTTASWQEQLKQATQSWRSELSTIYQQQKQLQNREANLVKLLEAATLLHEAQTLIPMDQPPIQSGIESFLNGSGHFASQTNG